MRIKPEDIPNALYTNFGHMFGPDLVEFLNAAIEAGVVSPPCHFIRHDGRIVKTGGHVRLWPGEPEMEHHEHWKGQTE